LTREALLSVEAARDAVLAECHPVGAEWIDTTAALGRISAEVIVSPIALPPWPNSAMDGYAIQAADTALANDADPIRLEVIGDLAAGAPPTIAVRPGAAIRIATGARLPEGADAVIAVEDTSPLDEAGQRGARSRDAAGPLPAACLVHLALEPGASVRAAGSDLEVGTTLLDPGDAVHAASVALLAGAAVTGLAVYRRPRVGVLATGDEVRTPGEPLGPAGIPDANGPGLRALVTAAGGEAVDLGIARDRLEDVVDRLHAGLEAGVDGIIVSGGVSVGPYDVVKTAIDSIGRIDLWRVAVQPGKPFAFGVGKPRDGRSPVLLFGLPGNPVSSAVTFELFVRPAIRRLAGRKDVLRPLDRAIIDQDVTKSRGRRAFLRVESERDQAGAPLRDERGRVRVRVAGRQGSHVISALAAADALVVIPEADDTLASGSEVALWWLDRA
jgi:molybdenum cofactor synthesis domain-containing protein